jgi:predicted acylesterase/phospholipase RssA
MRSVWTLVLLLALTAIAACESRSTCDACANPPVTPSPQYLCDDHAVVDIVGRSSVFTSPEPIDMLFLSGGGSHGAYGAGVLNGWSHAPGQQQRPTEFAVVTGVSAGALQATWAFLGSAYDDAMHNAYTSITDHDVYQLRWWPPFGSSVTTGKGLKKIIDREFTNDLIAKVGAQSGRRLLCVGTVNLDTGQFVAWNMTAIAQAGDTQLYRDVLRASASIPVVFPPVEVQKTLYVDGGTRQEVFASSILKLVETARMPIVPAGQTDKAHFLINLNLNVNRQCVQPHAKDIAIQSLQLFLIESVYGSVFRAKSELGQLDQKLDIDYRFIPFDYQVGFDSGTFNPALMHRLFCKGYVDGKKQWPKCLPDATDATPQCPTNDTASGPDACECEEPGCH